MRGFVAFMFPSVNVIKTETKPSVLYFLGGFLIGATAKSGDWSVNKCPFNTSLSF